MTRQQAIDLLDALAQRTMPARITLIFDAQGSPVYGVQLDTQHVYSGTELQQLATYCASKGLVVSASFEALGVT